MKSRFHAAGICDCCDPLPVCETCDGDGYMDIVDDMGGVVGPAPCSSCGGIGAQSGAHSERVNPCPACEGSGRKKVEAQG